MDCGWNLLHWLLAIAAVPVVMALGVLTWMLWNMLRGHGGWK